jgi:hypothetical protein
MRARPLRLMAAIPALLILPILLAGCRGASDTSSQEKWIKDYAAELSDRGLYAQAADAYKQFLLTPGLTDKKKANIHYMIAEIYRQNIYDYDSALAHYLAIKYLDPKSELLKDVDEKVVECLEKSGRSTDAQNELDNKTSLAPTGAGGKVVARIGSREITESELDRLLANSFGDPDKLTRQEKTSFLHNYVAQELMANAGERKGYQKDPDVLRRLEDFRRSLIAQKIFVEEVGGKSSVDPDKVNLYYEAHKDEFKDDKGNIKTFEEVRNDIYSKLSQQQQQTEAQKYIQRLLGAEHVQFIDDNITGKEENTDTTGGQK